MYITVPSVSYRYIVHHNIITLQLYYLLLVIRNRIDRFAIVRRKKKKRKDDTQHSNSCSLFSHIMITTESLRVIFCLPFNYICTEEVCILDNINAFYIYNNLCAITMGTNLFPPPLFSLFFVHRSVDFSLLFLLFPLCVPITIFAIFLSIVESMLLLQIDEATRYIDSLYSDSERVSIVSFLLYISIPFPLSFYCLSKTFVCAFASRTKKDRFGKSRERNAAWNRFEENEQLEEAISFFVSSSFSLSSSFSPSCSTRNKRIFST